MLNNNELKLNYAIAMAMAKNSLCKDKKVGVVVLNKYGHILTTGYNYVENCNNDCENCRVLHAEKVAFIKLLDNDPYYTVQTLFPCINCQEFLYKRGIKKIYYYDKTKNDAGLIESVCIKNIIDGGL